MIIELYNILTGTKPTPPSYAVARTKYNKGDAKDDGYIRRRRKERDEARRKAESDAAGLAIALWYTGRR